ASFRVSALNSGEWIIRFFLFVMVHLVSDCTHLTQCPKLLVRISTSISLFIGIYKKKAPEKSEAYMMFGGAGGS
ncbi:hypothetical protein, partial [Vibrio parahaemolyticus]|uniref:hypothetical protein n=1 Tax=Vibrio parahaemolyticus TaxID=670 RepID=UPI001D13DF66